MPAQLRHLNPASTGPLNINHVSTADLYLFRAGRLYRQRTDVEIPEGDGISPVPLLPLFYRHRRAGGSLHRPGAEIQERMDLQYFHHHRIPLLRIHFLTYTAEPGLQKTNPMVYNFLPCTGIAEPLPHTGLSGFSFLHCGAGQHVHDPLLLPLFL